MENKNLFHKIKKTLLEYKKTSYSDKTSNINSKVYKYIRTLAFALSLLLISNVSVNASSTIGGSIYFDYPFANMENKYYIILDMGDCLEMVTSDTPIYLVQGDGATRNNKKYDKDLYYFSNSFDGYEHNYSNYYYDDEWKYEDDFISLTKADLEKTLKTYKTNQNITVYDYLNDCFINDYSYTKNDFDITYPYVDSHLANVVPLELVNDRYYFLMEFNSNSGDYTLITSDKPLNFILGDSETLDPYFDDVLYGYTFYVSNSSDGYTFDGDIMAYRYLNGKWQQTYEKGYYPVDRYMIKNYVYQSCDYISNHNVLFRFGSEHGGDLFLYQNDKDVDYPVVEEPSPDSPPVDSENNNNSVNNYVEINGVKMPYNYAMLHYLIRIEFILGLLLTVTVVFFIINKLWSWCRRLFTTTF